MSQTLTFFLKDVINELIDTKSSLEGALFKLNYFARLIKNTELINYTDAEINGYRNMETPNYRRGISSLTMKLQTGYGHEQNADLPISMLDEPFQSGFRYFKVREGIRVIEQNMATYDAAKRPLLQTPLPMEMLGSLQKPANRLYKSDGGVAVTAAMTTTNANILPQILSTVRSRLLAFTTELAEQYGYDIEIEPFKNNLIVNNSTINNLFHTEILNKGDNNIINTGDNSSITAGQ